MKCADCGFFKKGKSSADHSHCQNPKRPKDKRHLRKDGGIETCKLFEKRPKIKIGSQVQIPPPKVMVRYIPLIQFVNWIREGKYFSYVRYGDGEWKALLKESGRNGRAHMITPEFHRDMRICLFKNAYTLTVLFGMQRNTYRPEGRQVEIEKFLEENNLVNIPWVSAETLHHASRDGELFSLIREMKERNVVIVGPEFLTELPKTLGLEHSEFVEVPERDCFEEKDRILRECLDIQADLGDGMIYSFSAGPAAEVFILHLQEEIPNNFFIDSGSMWDVFVGRRTRRYTQDREKYNEEILKKNLGEVPDPSCTG